MFFQRHKRSIIFVAIAELVGLISGLISRGGMEIYEKTAAKPPLTPPGWVFPVAWTILYALMGLATARISTQQDGNRRDWSLRIYALQLIVNFFWPLFFFNARQYGFAFVWLLVLLILVIIMTVLYFRQDKLAGVLVIPYCLWLVFAAYLNFGVMMLNK